MKLPLPGWVLQPYTAATVAVVHVYLGGGHLLKLLGGEVQWTHIWKGFGAMAGAYVFAALAFRQGRPFRAKPPSRDDADHVIVPPTSFRRYWLPRRGTVGS